MKTDGILQVAIKVLIGMHNEKVRQEKWIQVSEEMTRRVFTEHPLETKA